jgi:hypothetical protein
LNVGFVEDVDRGADVVARRSELALVAEAKRAVAVEEEDDLRGEGLKLKLTF